MVGRSIKGLGPTQETKNVLSRFVTDAKAGNDSNRHVAGYLRNKKK